ncbi:MAG: serine/threonine-protein kinase [Gemmataceae bacterium]|nr:serine/threonine protein kinase [Gemmata sp.]MDW8198816.1 serine/threonine-protein kinase [Gemmataceae bacterium]
MATQTRLAQLNSPFLSAVRRSGLLTPDDILAALADSPIGPTAEPLQLATLLVRKKLLTKYQAMQLLAGRTQGFVLGRYKILDGIRQDRVGLVFKAEDTQTQRFVALKVLPTDRANDPTILKAFVEEVRAAAQVQHPSITAIYDMDCWQGTHFVVSEYVAAPTLDKLIADRGPLLPHVAAQLVAQTAVALMHVHERNLIHRDIKPGNIAVLPERQIKLLDLGLTHMLESPWARVTKRISTKEYAEEIAHIAPEQAWGCEQDARSDIYSLGSTFYYLLTGVVPFPGLAPEMMAERQIRGVPSPAKLKPTIPPEIDAIVQRMGAKDPHLRYPTARDVVKALHPWLPVAQWQALGLAAEMPTNPPRAATSAQRGKDPGGSLQQPSPPKSGFLHAIRRIFGS